MTRSAAPGATRDPNPGPREGEGLLLRPASGIRPSANPVRGRRHIRQAVASSLHDHILVIIII